MDLINQKTQGDNSPTINGDAKNCVFGDVHITAKNKSIQIRTITNLILKIGEMAENHNFHREDTEKDLTKKLNERFKQNQNQLVNRYSELLDLYSNSYDEAKKHIELNETLADKIAIYLKQKSREILEKKNNPIDAIAELRDFLSDQLNSSVEDNQEYDINAIEFYLYKELISCNVFPNDLKS